MERRRSRRHNGSPATSSALYQVELSAYLSRIQYDGPVKPDLQTLQKLHLQHATHIPFENLDIQLGFPILLDIEHLQEKLIHRRRGGYCFEQNHLFQAALLEIGYNVTACDARVNIGTNAWTARTHMLLIVSLPESKFLCDVGFGGDGLLRPVRIDGESHTQFLWSYRVHNDGNLKTLQSKKQEEWIDLYQFDPSGCLAVDFEVANWYTSTHPGSRFTTTLTAQLPLPDARHILRNRLYSIDRANSQESREIKTKSELLDLLRSVFGLSFPPETEFRNPVFDR
jgi:N-hydroxyarylamine O-acetyltransferase